jgi:hypothetical protein
MDRIGGRFGAYDDAHEDAGPDGFEPHDSGEETAPEAPLSPVGQDERRMQVRAYNHWASLLGDGSFPNITDLHPETLEDFGPYGILLDFSGPRGIDDPAIRFLGAKLAEECGAEGWFKRLSDVPGGSLLSRITDHYLQIIANQAPIGFEAEFVNQRGVAVLYRGILMPWSSNGTKIDFVFGVINWKEVADAATADALLSAIDAALGAPPDRPQPPEGDTIMDRIRNLSPFAPEDGVKPFSTDTENEAAARDLPVPVFGTAREEEIEAPLELVDEIDADDFDEDAGEATEWGAGFAGFSEDETVYSVDYGAQGLEDGENADDVDGVVDPLADETVGFGLASLVSRSARSKPSVTLPGLPDAGSTMPRPYEPEEAAFRPLDTARKFDGDRPEEDEDAFELVEALEEDAVVASAATAERAGSEETDFPAFSASAPAFPDEEPEGLYDCLAAARELAQTARSSEDRGRKALYQAVSRAYDFSLEAVASPEDFAELVAENGLIVQDRAPMTPVVKLVFGADYDKTRLTEFATVLGFAHRTGVARGTLGNVLAEAEGGLKGIVQAERRARKGADNGTSLAAGIKPGLAKKLRKLDGGQFDELALEGPEFALVMVRRLPSGALVVLGEVPEDLPLIEKAARRLVG